MLNTSMLVVKITTLGMPFIGIASTCMSAIFYVIIVLVVVVTRIIVTTWHINRFANHPLRNMACSRRAFCRAALKEAARIQQLQELIHPDSYKMFEHFPTMPSTIDPDGPSMAQRASKWLRDGPTGAQDDSRWAPVGPKQVQDAHKRAQDGPQRELWSVLGGRWRSKSKNGVGASICEPDLRRFYGLQGACLGHLGALLELPWAS